MKTSLVRFMTIVAITLGGCNSEPAEEPGQSQSATETQAAPGGAAGDPAVAHHPEGPARPPEKQDSMQMEGTWERFTATLIQPNTSLPFSTYVPKDMIFEQASSGEGEGYHFYTNFAGKRNDNAFVMLFLLPPGATREQAQRIADAFVASRTQNKEQIARAQLGTHQDRFFYWAETYPREYSEGVGPRSAYIRRQWIWLGDGKSLEATLQPRP
jgi:hypothetical protein